MSTATVIDLTLRESDANSSGTNSATDQLGKTAVETEPDLNPANQGASAGDRNALVALSHIRIAAELIADGMLPRSENCKLGDEIAKLSAELIRVARNRAGIEQPCASDSARPVRVGPLSARESEVCLLLARGCTVREVSETLKRSPKTINNHRTQILRKLDLRNSAELARYAIRNGFISA